MDLLARILAVAGLCLSGVVALVQCLTYRRGRRSEPNVSFGPSRNTHRFLVAREGLYVIRGVLQNRASTPNCVLDIKACGATRRSRSTLGKAQSSRMRVEPLALAPHVRGQGPRLAVAPEADITDEEWGAVMGNNSRLPDEGLWTLPMHLAASTAVPILLTVGAVARPTNTQHLSKLVLIIDDVAGRRHRTVVPLPAHRD